MLNLVNVWAYNYDVAQRSQIKYRFIVSKFVIAMPMLRIGLLC
jgi:hypothetical protein